MISKFLCLFSMLFHFRGCMDSTIIIVTIHQHCHFLKDFVVSLSSMDQWQLWLLKIGSAMNWTKLASFESLWLWSQQKQLLHDVLTMLWCPPCIICIADNFPPLLQSCTFWELCRRTMLSGCHEVDCVQEICAERHVPTGFLAHLLPHLSSLSNSYNLWSGTYRSDPVIPRTQPPRFSYMQICMTVF